MTVKQTFISSAELNYPKVLPTLDLNFAHTRTLDPRITFTRASGGSYVGPDGLIKYADVNEPRFDHDPVTGESLGLLIEEKRTNLKIWSQNIELDFLRVSITTITQNEIISPDGNQTAGGIVPNSTNVAHYIDKVLTSTSGITASQKICSSVFFKKGVGKEGLFQIYEQSGNALQGLRFDFETKQLFYTVSNEFNTGGGVTDGYGVIEYPNGWYRLWIAGYPNTTTTARRIRIRFTNETGALEFSGDGVSSYLYAWGVQVEEGSFPTSYIPTQESTRTRAADNAVITGKNFSDFFNFYEGTSFISFKFGPTTLDSRNFVRYGTSSINTMIQRTTIDGNAHALTFAPPPPSGGTSQVAIPNTNTFTAPYLNSNSCFSYKSGDIAYSTSGFIRYTNNTTFLPLNDISRQTNEVKIGSATSSNYLNGWIKRFIYFPKRLSNEQLQALTR